MKTLGINLFYKKGCKECARVEREVKKAIHGVRKVIFYKTHVDDFAEWFVKDFNVKAVPSLAILKNGTHMATISGAPPSAPITQRKLTQIIKSWRPKNE